MPTPKTPDPALPNEAGRRPGDPPPRGGRTAWLAYLVLAALCAGAFVLYWRAA